MNALYLIRHRNTGEFLKIVPKTDNRIELEFDEFNVTLFVTEKKELAEKLCNPRSYRCSVEDMAGYHIAAPLHKSWSYGQDYSVKFEDGVLEVLEVLLQLN